MFQRTALVIASSMLAATSAAQISTTPQQGLAEHTPRHASIVDARIVVAPGQVIENGSVELRDGLIVDVRAGRREAPGAMVVEAHGKSIFPAFIDVHGSYGFDGKSRCPVAEAAAGGAGPGRGRGGGGFGGGSASAPIAASARHWNDRVCPERDVSRHLALDADGAKALRHLGFAATVATPGSGVLRGQSALLSLRDQPTPQQNLLAHGVAQHAYVFTGYG